MRFEIALGIVLIALSILLLVIDFLAYAKKKLTEGFGLIWALLAILLMVAGILLLAAERVILVVLTLLMVILMLFLFGVSRAVSVLTMKNQELAMQVSLLNQENESILQDLAQMKEKMQDE